MLSYIIYVDHNVDLLLYCPGPFHEQRECRAKAHGRVVKKPMVELILEGTNKLLTMAMRTKGTLASSLSFVGMVQQD